MIEVIGSVAASLSLLLSECVVVPAEDLDWMNVEKETSKLSRCRGVVILVSGEIKIDE